SRSNPAKGPASRSKRLTARLHANATVPTIQHAPAVRLATRSKAVNRTTRGKLDANCQRQAGTSASIQIPLKTEPTGADHRSGSAPDALYANALAAAAYVASKNRPCESRYLARPPLEAPHAMAR